MTETMGDSAACGAVPAGDMYRPADPCMNGRFGVAHVLLRRTGKDRPAYADRTGARDRSRRR